MAVCQTIENILITVNPEKRCVDDPTPASKQAQQRKRRFKSNFYLR